MGALPKALARRGHRVMVVVPRYSNYEEGWETGVRTRFRVMGSDTEVGTVCQVLARFDKRWQCEKSEMGLLSIMPGNLPHAWRISWPQQKSSPGLTLAMLERVV